MHFIRLISFFSCFDFETLPCLLSFYLFDSLSETADARLFHLVVELPARAVLIAETSGSTPGTKRSTVNPSADVSLYTNLHIPTNLRV